MSYRLLLNKQLLLEGDQKTLTALFNDLSGLNFAKNPQSGWLDKMSAGESYTTYLKIKAAEFRITEWTGELSLECPQQNILRVHFFDTHKKIINEQAIRADKDTG